MCKVRESPLIFSFCPGWKAGSKKMTSTTLGVQVGHSWRVEVPFLQSPVDWHLRQNGGRRGRRRMRALVYGSSQRWALRFLVGYLPFFSCLAPKENKIKYNCAVKTFKINFDDDDDEWWKLLTFGKISHNHLCLNEDLYVLQEMDTAVSLPRKRCLNEKLSFFPAGGEEGESMIVGGEFSFFHDLWFPIICGWKKEIKLFWLNN